VPAADDHAIALLLVKLAQLAADFPEIREIDLNPVLADETGVIAVDARVSIPPVEKLLPAAPPGHLRFAIRPYPKEWERHLKLSDGTAVSGSAGPPQRRAALSPVLCRRDAAGPGLRFFAPLKEFSHPFIARLTQIDYARAMAFIALDEASGEVLGVVRLHANADYDKGEYAILVRSDLKGHGLGYMLMQLLIEYARAEGIRTLEGQVLQENTAMLNMCRELGFGIGHDPEDPEVCLAKLSV